MATQPGTSPTGPVNNKRKRGPGDQGAGREAKAQNINTNGDHDTTNYGLLLQGDAMLADDSTRTAQAALAAPMNPSTYPEPSTFEGTPGMQATFDDNSPSAITGMGSAQALMEARGGNNNGPPKPAVGTAEWHQQRKDNHKEVERRRREVINEGIENIAKIVPGTEKNKGAILQRTYEYIQELVNKETSFQNERATFEIALKELTNRLDRMKESARNAWAESAKWQQRCREAGLHFDDYDDGGITADLEEDVDAAVVS